MPQPSGRSLTSRPLPRRELLLGAGTLIVSASFPAVAKRADIIGDIERRLGGRLGVFALDLHTGRVLAHRAEERFKLHSTFKGLLAALVLADVGRGIESLEAEVRFGKADLLPASPITEEAVSRGVLTVRRLCEAVMYRSDNAAANLLMARRGGPARLTRFVRALGDGVTRIDSYEGQMEGRPADYDSTTPHAIVRTVRRLLMTPSLPVSAREQLEEWMIGNVVGRSRLRAAFPVDWISGDRTGTADGACNDYAFARRPGRAPLLVSAYHSAPGMNLPEQEAVLRAVGRAVVRWQQT